MKRTLPLRSLAAGAVGALAVAGLTLPPPSAVAAGPGVALVSQAARLASVRYDGVDATVQLTAQRLEPGATIGFEFHRNPRATNGAAGWTVIAGTPTETGSYLTQEWEPPAALVGRRVALRAVAVGSTTTYSLRPNVLLAGQDDLEHSVSLGPGYLPFVPPSPDSEFTETGYFVQPYADSGRTGYLLVAPGTTTATGGRVAVEWFRPSDRTFRGRVDAAVRPASLKAPDPESGFSSTSGGAFEAILDITAFTPDPGDVLAVRATRDSDDVRPTTLYEQTIGSVTASTGSSQVRTGETAAVTVTVTDATSQPVAGAEVRRRTDGALVGYTNGFGQVVARQAAGTSTTYYANAADTDAFTAGEDQESSTVSITTYDPVPTSIIAIASDGALWDRDEYLPGDLRAEIFDQQGRPIGQGTGVQYRVYRTSGAAPTYATTTADSRGRVVVPFARSRPAGEYRLDVRFASTPGTDPASWVEFTMGDAALTLTPATNPVRTGIGGQIDYAGRLMVASEPLTGRRISLRFTRGVEVVPGLRPDAAIVQGRRRVLARTVETDGQGRFTVTVDDAAERPRASEITGRLRAETVALPPSTSQLDGEAYAYDSSGTAFGDGRRGRVRIALAGADNGGQGDVLRVTAPDSVTGERVRIYRTAPGARTLVTTRRLGRAGDLPRVVVADRNGNDLTTYVVELVPSQRVIVATSAPRRVR